MNQFLPIGYLSVQESIEQVGALLFGREWTPDETQNNSNHNRSQAVERFQKHLYRGDVQSSILHDGGITFSLPNHAWGSDDISKAFSTGRIHYDYLEGQVIIEEISFKKWLATLGTSKSISTVNAERRCHLWLTELMSCGKPKTKKKSEYQKEAFNQFGVGTKPFTRAWANAVSDTENSNWSKPGPRTNPKLGEC